MKKHILIISFMFLIIGTLFAGETGSPDSDIIIKFGFPVLLMIIAFIAGRYLKPWINEKHSRLENAQEIAFIADRITDELKLKYPEKTWPELLNKAIDKLIKSCDLIDSDDSKGIAQREIASQIVKKGFVGLIK